MFPIILHKMEDGNSTIFFKLPEGVISDDEHNFFNKSKLKSKKSHQNEELWNVSKIKFNQLEN